VGTLARAALALGWDGLLLLPGCADALHPRALRSARGAPFRLPHARATAATDAVALAERLGLTLLTADAAREEGGGDADPLPPLVPPTSNGVCLVLGAERAGVSPALTRAAAGRVTIPMAGAMESLNVGAAGAVLMFALGGGGRASWRRACLEGGDG
jgi:TrmH family RNA methyltransferase